MHNYQIVCAWVLVLSSGNPALLSFGPQIGYLTALAALVPLLLLSQSSPNERDKLIFGAFLVITTAHVLTFGTGIASATLGFFVKIAIAWIAASQIPNLLAKIVTILAHLAALSLAFYIPHQLGIPLPAILRNLQIPIPFSEIVHIGIHNFHTPEFQHRNSGVFWEPGAFASYLCIALLILAMGVKVESQTRKATLIVAALITTFSTAGYIVAALIALIAVANGSRSTKRRSNWPAIAVIGVLTTSWIAFTEIPFLSEKIGHQSEGVINLRQGYQITRLGNALYDLEQITERPLIGWSAAPSTRTRLDPNLADVIALQGGGLTGFAVRYGLAGLFLALFALYQSLKVTSRSSQIAALSVTALIALMASQQLLSYPLTLALLFTGNPLNQAARAN